MMVDNSSANRLSRSAEVVTEHLEKPLLDNRSYRVIKLPNELEALIIHDPDTDKASAALDVNVGSFSDPDDMPGMAHAVEHLLFMGTEKYPVENDYNQYLTAHSGYSNAFTAATDTNYYFEVAATSSEAQAEKKDGSNGVTAEEEQGPLYGALDRFAQFFIAPLFLEETLDRELRAVDSENKKNLQSDTWRLYQLQKTLSSKDHPFHHFSTGNLKTLKEEPLQRGVQIRKEFMDFHSKYYSANRMKLVVLGRESLDTLEKWVEEFFTEVPNKNLPQNRWDNAQPFTDAELGTQIFAKPVMDSRSLDVNFPFVDEEKYYEGQPGRYVGHLLGHEGPGSILAYLKQKGWANGLSAGVNPVCPGTAFMSVTVRLTQEGLKNYKEIVKIIFQYIALLKEQPPQKWIVDEIKLIGDVDFKFKQKSPASKTTSKLSGTMQKPFPRDQILSGMSLIRKLDEQAISQGLDCLRPNNFRMTLVSQEFPGDWDQKEKWYGTEYKYERIPEDFLSEIQKAYVNSAKERPQELHMPHKNEFIPTRLDVEKKEVKEPLKHPWLIRNDDKVRLWFKKDDTFWVPKGTINVTLRTELLNLTPENAVMSQLYKELVMDSLQEYAYDAELAGLDYYIATHKLGLDVGVSGYNDKMHVLLEKVLVAMRDLEVKDDRFTVIKERLSRGYKNAEFQQPYYQVGSYTRWLQSTHGWLNEHYAAELEHITPDDIRTFYPQLLRQFYLEILAHGNIYKEDALKMTDLVEKTLKPRPFPPNQWSLRRSLKVPPGGNFVYQRTLKDPANVNHCIEYALTICDKADREASARLMLFGQLTEEAAFNQLRTKEQLGYVVFSGIQTHVNSASYRVLIQSERDPQYLEARIESFLEKVGTTLDEMGEEEFNSHKRSLINKRLEKVKNLGQETGRFWNHITTEFYDFEQVDEDAAHIRPITLPQMREFFAHYVSPSSPNRAKLSVHLVAQQSALLPESTSGDTFKGLIKGLASLLTSANLGIKDSAASLEKKLTDLLEGMPDATEQQKLAVGGAIQQFLTKDLKLSADAVNTVMAKGMELLSGSGTQTQTNGEPQSKTNGTKSEQEQVAVDATAQVAMNGHADGANGEVKEVVQGEKETGKPIIIEDPIAWKAGLIVSKAARPVKDLAVFEELESKL